MFEIGSRARMLPALTAPLTQIVLTPFLGVNAAQERLAGTVAATL